MCNLKRRVYIGRKVIGQSLSKVSQNQICHVLGIRIEIWEHRTEAKLDMRGSLPRGLFCFDCKVFIFVPSWFFILKLDLFCNISLLNLLNILPLFRKKIRILHMVFKVLKDVVAVHHSQLEPLSSLFSLLQLTQ